MSDISIENESGIVYVTLNRPEKRNALTFDMFEGLLEAQQAITDDSNANVVILKGAGASFCSGLDIMSVMKDPTQVPKLLTRIPDSDCTLVQQIALGWQDLKIPVIAALQGHVYGAGFQIAMGADLRIAAPDTVFGVKEIQWGLIPDMSISLTLPELCARDQLMDWVLTGRDISLEEAQANHLVTRVHDDPLTAANELARSILERSPDAIRAAKHLLSGYPDRTRSENLQVEAQLQQQLIGKPNQLAAVQAKVSKQSAKFAPPHIHLL